MEVKPGYKQTEVGVIPEEWQSSTVRGIASRTRNAIVGGPFGSDLVSNDYVEDGVPVIRGQNMSGQWVSGDFAFVTPAKAKSLSANLARPNDIVFTQRGTLGQVSLIPDKPFEAYLVSQSQMKLSVNRQVAEPLFFFYVFASDHQQELIRGGTIQTGVPHINLGILRSIPVQLPPLREQRAIATALSDVDGLLGGLDRLIAKKRDLKQAAMQQLLTGQTRLHGFHGEWEVKTLHEVCQKIQDGTHFSPKLGGNDYLYVTSKNIRFGKLDMSTAERISADEHFKIYARCDVKKGDLLLTKDGANTGNAGLNPMDEPFSLLSSVAMLRFDSRLHASGYFMYQILSTYGQMQIKEAMSGNAITRLTLKKIRALRFSVATLREQTAIAEVLTDMDAELAALEQRWETTRALKQAMMQELLTGRTRLVRREDTELKP